MKRILIIGSGGSGKSTLALQVSERLGLPVVHLDAQFWQAGWVEMPREAWAERVGELIRREAWVMDGNYGGTLDHRLAAADTVVFLDLPRWLCLWRVTKRWARFHGTSRPDMTPGCPERLTWAFALWIWRYPHDRRPLVLDTLRAVQPDKQVVLLRSRAEVRRFLDRLPATAARPPTD